MNRLIKAIGGLTILACGCLLLTVIAGNNQNSDNGEDTSSYVAPNETEVQLIIQTLTGVPLDTSAARTDAPTPTLTVHPAVTELAENPTARVQTLSPGWTESAIAVIESLPFDFSTLNIPDMSIKHVDGDERNPNFQYNTRDEEYTILFSPVSESAHDYENQFPLKHATSVIAGISVEYGFSDAFIADDGTVLAPAYEDLAFDFSIAEWGFRGEIHPTLQFDPDPDRAMEILEDFVETLADTFDVTVAAATPTASQEAASTPLVTTIRYVNTTTLNVRAGPGTDQSIVKSLGFGAEITVVGISAAGDWYEIDNGDSTAWVFASLTSETRPSAQQSRPAQAATSAPGATSVPISQPACTVDCSQYPTLNRCADRNQPPWNVLSSREIACCWPARDREGDGLACE